MVTCSLVCFDAYEEGCPGANLGMSFLSAKTGAAAMSTLANHESRFIYFLYFLARAIASPLLVLYFLYRGCRDRRYFRGFAQRLGLLPATYKRTAPGSIWLHAVSVGEVISAVRLIHELRAANPTIPIYLSTATRAGRGIA